MYWTYSKYYHRGHSKVVLSHLLPILCTLTSENKLPDYAIPNLKYTLHLTNTLTRPAELDSSVPVHGYYEQNWIQ